MRKLIIGVICLLMYGTSVAGQEDSLLYRHGRLANGLTYYVRHTELQKGKADFYLVQNVGALMEEDYQNGLAHFLEHMAFNGTENFPNGIQTFLKRRGVTSFNAYTGQNETVYRINNVPVSSPGLTDSCLLIMRDWSGFLLLQPAEVERERGVILEEWRQRRGVGERLQEQLKPYVYNGSKYVEHNVIGNPDIIKNCTPQDIRAYYQDYYRPDQQAVIVVGDIDAVGMEREIHRLFDAIPARINPKPRIVYEIPDNEEPFYCKVTDKELPTNTMLLIKRVRNRVPETLEDMMRDNILRSFFGRIVMKDLSAYVREQSPDILTTSVSYVPLVRNYSALNIMLEAYPGKDRTALRQLMEELERVKRFVLNEESFRAEVEAYGRQVDESEQMQDRMSNDVYVQLYQNNFLEGNPVTTIAEDIALSRQILAKLTVEDLREWIARWDSSDNNWVYIMQGNDPAYDYPSAEEITATMRDARKAELQPWNQEVKAVPLMDFEVEGGKIAGVKKVKALDAEVWTLSNGCRVWFKQTDAGNGVVGLHGESEGGLSVLAAEDIPSAEVIPDMFLASGLYHHPAKMMEAILKGHKVSMKVGIGAETETVNGSAMGEDAEMMFQLIWLAFEKPRFDRDYFDKYVYINRMNYRNTPRTVKDTVNEAMRKLHLIESPRIRMANEQYYADLDFDRMKAIYADRFRDASDFTFYLVGDISREKAQELVSRYLGSLPSDYRKEKAVKYDLTRKGSVHETIEANIPDAKYMVNVEFTNHLKTSLRDELTMEVLKMVLKDRYTRTIREDEGGAYGVNVSASAGHEKGYAQSLSVNFNSSLEKGDRMRALVFSIIDEICREGVDDETVSDEILLLKKSRRESLEDKSLNYWMLTLKRYARTGEDYSLPAYFEKLVDKINGKQVQDWAKRFFATAECKDIVIKSK